MPFEELKPAKKTSGTGVRVSHGERMGLVVSVTGEALEALGGPSIESVTALLDADPVVPRLRLVAGGPFKASNAPGRGNSSATKVMRLGHHGKLPREYFSGDACEWEPGAVSHSIDIDLPRELRAVNKQQKATTGMLGDRKVSAVTLPGRAKEPA